MKETIRILSQNNIFQFYILETGSSPKGSHDDDGVVEDCTSEMIQVAASTNMEALEVGISWLRFETLPKIRNLNTLTTTTCGITGFYIVVVQLPF